jgi:hypothetical protein
MPEDEARAFAQLLKRLGYEDCRRLSHQRTTYAGREESWVMWSAVQMVERQFAEAGFAPR